MTAPPRLPALPPPHAVATPPAIAEWLDRVAPDPAGARRRIQASTVTITGTGPVAAAARAAFAAAGLPTSTGRAPAGRAAAGSEDSRAIRLRAGAAVAVATGADERVGYVTAPAPAAETARIAGLIADRLGLDPTPAVPAPLAGMLGGVAALRLICAVAGLPDPADASTGDTIAAASTVAISAAPWSRVLVARPGKVPAAYHPWLRHGGRAAEAPRSFDDAVRRLGALCDPDLGVLPPPAADRLPQLPLPLTRCGLRTTTGTPGDTAAGDAGGGSGVVIGCGPTTTAAMLDAALRAAERLLDPRGTGRLAVGVDSIQADGVLLRRAAFDLAWRSGATQLDSRGIWPCWSDDPIAHRWWTTLTDRLGVAARCTVRHLAPDVFAAVVDDGVLLGWAVEATPGAAAAFATLQATAREQARLAGVTADRRPAVTCGAALSPSPYGGGTAFPASSPTWPVTRTGEARLQRSLCRLVPPGRWPRPTTRRGADGLRDGLRAAGFAVHEAVRAPRHDGPIQAIHLAEG